MWAEWTEKRVDIVDLVDRNREWTGWTTRHVIKRLYGGLFLPFHPFDLGIFFIRYQVILLAQLDKRLFFNYIILYRVFRHTTFSGSEKRQGILFEVVTPG